MSELHPEKELEAQLKPLQNIEVQVDDKTKQALLEKIKTRAEEPEEVSHEAFRLHPYFRPAMGLAVASIAVLSLLAWQGNWLGTRGVPDELTIRTKGEMATTALSAGRMDSTAESTTSDMMIAPADDYLSVQRNREYRFVGESSDLNWRYADAIYRVQYRTLNEAGQNALASALQLPVESRQTECQNVEIMPYPMPEIVLLEEGSPEKPVQDSTDCANPMVSYKEGSRQLSIMSLEGKSTFSFDAQAIWDDNNDPYLRAQRNYPNLSATLNLPGIEARLKSTLNEWGLLSDNLVEDFVLIPAQNHQYICPSGEAISWSKTNQSELNPTPDICVKSDYGVSDSQLSEDVSSSFMPDNPTPTANRPRIYQANYLLIPDDLQIEAGDFGVIEISVDHEGSILYIHGKVPEAIEELPLRSASAGEVLDLLNQGELESNNALHSGARPLMLENDTSPSTSESLTDRIAVNRVGRELMVVAGTHSEEYYVPAFRLTGQIQYGQTESDQAVRSDSENQARCAALQSELDSKEKEPMPEDRPIQPAPSVDRSSTVLETEIAPLPLDMGEGTSGVEEPGSARGAPPTLDPVRDALYEELYSRQCHLYESTGEEEFPFSETVTAFPGLKIEQGE